MNQLDPVFMIQIKVELHSAIYLLIFCKSADKFLLVLSKSENKEPGYR